jgi:hypothetical protein
MSTPTPSSPRPRNTPLDPAAIAEHAPAESQRSRGPDRRKSEMGSPTGLERRRGPGRRLSDFVKAAEEGEMTQEQFLFLMAIEGFKKANNKVYPSWTDVLEVLRLLGYRKTLASQIKLRNATDWTEAADAPAEVRREPAPARRNKAA